MQPHPLRDLDYSTTQCKFISNFVNSTNNILSSGACGVDVGEFYYVTGGRSRPVSPATVKTVSKYSKTGWVEDLPDLNEERERHACGKYLDDEGNFVSY